ncbi:hypothetical protein, partial [Mesorhizobium sp.]
MHTAAAGSIITQGTAKLTTAVAQKGFVKIGSVARGVKIIGAVQRSTFLTPQPAGWRVGRPWLAAKAKGPLA